MSRIEEQPVDLPPRDGITLSAVRWSNGDAPRAVLVVAHGMGEHSRRYLAPLRPLIEDGVTVYALDHRGHGASARDGDYGSFGPGGFPGVVADLAALVSSARADVPRVPLALLGHSMGSFVSQLFLLEHAALIDGLALSGSAALDGLAVVMGEPDVLAALNAPFQPSRTPFDWLSRDEREVDAYIADPWCGFTLTEEAFGSIFAQAGRLADPSELATVPKDLPIYVFSGLADPLALSGALELLIERYRAAGLSVTTDLYPAARHEILNETNRAEVVGRLTQWLDTLAVRTAPAHA